jgi:hypothetical protein
VRQVAAAQAQAALGCESAEVAVEQPQVVAAEQAQAAVAFERERVAAVERAAQQVAEWVALILTARTASAERRAASKVAPAAVAMAVEQAAW